MNVFLLFPSPSMQPVVRIDVLWEATKCKKEFLKSLNESLAEAF